MPFKKQYLIVDAKRHRRHSAPDYLGVSFENPQSDLLKKEYWCRASVSDFSVLVENQEESGSSLELDTSTLSRELSPVPTTKTSPQDSYQSLPTIDIEEGRRDNDDETACYSLGSWFIWKNILLSQLIAGCVAVMYVSNISIRESSQNVIINGQNLPHYILLGAIWTTKLALRNDGRGIVEVLKLSGFRYLFLSFLHVESSYLLCSSFHHHFYLGNQLIDCVAATLSLAVAYVFMEVEFHLLHLYGFGFTIIGALGLSAANAISFNDNQYDMLLGDVLRMASGICLAFNSIAQEIIIKSIDLVEYMGMIGLIGSLICGIQTMTLEANKIVLKNFAYWSNILNYSTAQFFLNSLTPIVLRDMGATGLHLALTTSGFYSYFIGLIAHYNKFHMLYLLSFVVATIGSALFTIKRTSYGTQYFFPVKVILPKGS